MIYPTLTPGNVNRDFVDAFGGYNHNLRIGDNEFYDTENMVSTRYPVLASRGKRGTVPSKYTPPFGKLCGALYRSAFYTVIYTIEQQVAPLHVYKDGVKIAEFSNNVIADNRKRSLIMMGAYLIILPDKLYVNVEKNNDFGTIEIENEAPAGDVTVQPCFSDGSVAGVDYIGDKRPDNYTDNFVWIDTSNDPPSVKRYIEKDDTWIQAIFQYTRFTATETDISDGISVDDNITIDGVSDKLNGVTRVVLTPNEYSIVVQKQFENTEITILTPIKEQKEGKKIRCYCGRNVQEGDYANRDILIGSTRIQCTENTQAEAYEYYVKRNLSITSFTDHLTTINKKQRGIYSGGYYIYKVKISQTSGEGIFDTVEAEETVLVRVGEKEYNACVCEFYHHTNDGYTASDEIGLIPLERQKFINMFPNGDIPANTRIYPVQRGESDLYETTLTLESAIGVNEKICVYPDFVKTIETPVAFSRKMPLMDHVIESNNRLWGCRYGENADGEIVNEIYASKLGDFKNWQAFQGISSDSYIASCGTDGAWTGAINYLSRPVFFKENYIHTVYGAYPAQYNITNVAARGVQKGSSESLAILDEVLYYQSTEGICTYNGSLPVNISAPLGDIRYHNVIGCGYSGKYYAKMVDNADKSSLMVYDSRRNIWHKENDEDIISLCPVDDNVYYITNSRDLKSFFGAPAAGSPLVKWYFESGMYGLSEIDSKYVTRLNLRLALGRGAHMIVSICYNNSDKWHRLCHVVRKDINPFTLPIKPFRCDHFRLRFDGEGDVMIFSISKTTEQGSDRT